MIRLIPSMHESNNILESNLIGCGCGCGATSEDWQAGFAAGIEQS